jgi:hypothetical protein
VTALVTSVDAQCVTRLGDGWVTEAPAQPRRADARAPFVLAARGPAALGELADTLSPRLNRLQPPSRLRLFEGAVDGGAESAAAEVAALVQIPVRGAEHELPLAPVEMQTQQGLARAAGLTSRTSSMSNRCFRERICSNFDPSADTAS